MGITIPHLALPFKNPQAPKKGNCSGQESGFPEKKYNILMKSKHLNRMNENLEFITTYLDEEREGHHFPGLSVCIVHDQETLLSRGWGFAHLDARIPADQHTTYRIGSITKVFTSILVLRGVERGLLKLDDPVLLTILEVSCLKSTTAITFRHCLTHTSGLPMMPPLQELVPSFDGMPTLEDLTGIQFPDVNRIIESLSDTELQFTPGEGHGYSNFGMTLAGEGAARSIRMSYRDAVLEVILNPIGMAYSGFRKNDQVATGYFDFGEGPISLPDYEIAGFAPAGGIFSSAADMARFMAWNFCTAPAPILSVTARDLMQVKHHDLEGGRYVHETQGGIGLGWFLSNIGNYTLIEHGGADMGYVAFTGLIPELKLGVFLATNTGQDPVSVAKMGHDVLEVLVG